MDTLDLFLAFDIIPNSITKRDPFNQTTWVDEH